MKMISNTHTSIYFSEVMTMLQVDGIAHGLKPRSFAKSATFCSLDKFPYLAQILHNSMDFHFPSVNYAWHYSIHEIFYLVYLSVVATTYHNDKW